MKRTITSVATISIVLSGAFAATACDAEPAEAADQEVEERCGDNDQGENEDWMNWWEKAYAKKVRNKALAAGLKPMPAPPKPAKKLVELGQALSFDKILSGNKNISCMTCHHPLLATDDDHALSIGEGGVGLGLDRVHPENTFIPRNAPPLFNLHDLDTMFWDGRVDFHGTVKTPAREEITPEMLEVMEFGAAAAQAMFPVTSRREMRGELGTNDLAEIRDDNLTPQWALLMERLGAIPEYVDMFEDAYPGTNFADMTFAHAANAIAAFEIDSFAADDTPWDRFLRGELYAMTMDQIKGADLFVGRANCVNCHTGTSLSDLQFHNTALPQFGPGKGDGTFKDDDIGRGRVTYDTAENYHFRTAPLRNVALTGPYGHAGQFQQLEDFIAHYRDPETSLLNYDINNVEPLLQDTILDNQAEVLANFDPTDVVADIDEDEVPLIAAFLNALTDENSTDLTDTIPATVPSGLPVEEIVVTPPINPAGKITVDLGFDASGGREYQIWEQSMCDGEARLDIEFDRDANKLDVRAVMDGLPYRPSYCYDYDPSHPYNAYPECVSDGRWQVWLVGHVFSLRSVFYYDAVSGDLIGNEHDVDANNLPPTAFPLELPVLQMLCTDFFESDPQTLKVDETWSYDYDNVLDMLGSAGVYVGVLPPNLYNPNDLIVYYTEGGLPAELAMNFDDVIDDIAEGRGGIMIGTSYEPWPKPDYLAARDNIMIGWGGMWPEQPPALIPPKPEGAECGTNFQWDGTFGAVVPE